MNDWRCAISEYLTALVKVLIGSECWDGNRPLGKRHGIDAYAYEELVAEMGAAFTCAHCHLPARLEHASYIENWLQALRNDKRLILTAAGKAQAAADYLLGLSAAVPSPAVEALAA